MKTQILELLLPVRTRAERFALHQELLLARAPELLCEEELEPKPPRETLDDVPCEVPVALLPGRAAVVLPAECRLRELP
jgi:hypothetical protein